MSTYTSLQNDIKKLENICSKGVDARFKEAIIVNGHFEKSLELLNESDNIMLITGFCIKDAMIGETDGPIGAVCMAKALESLGKKVSIVTDKYSTEILRTGTEHYGLKAVIICVDIEFDKNKAEELLNRVNPDTLLFIERPGKNQDGDFYSMSGESITDIIPDTDHLFYEARGKNIKIIAVGDGGNEVGMDLIRTNIIKNVNKGDLICANTRADLLIVSGVSNWGCYAMIGGLSVLNNKNFLPSVNEEIIHLAKIVAIGAVDGVSKKSVSTVDGYSLEHNMQIVKDVASIISNRDKIQRHSYELEDGRKVIVTFEEAEGYVTVREDFDAETENTHERQQYGWQCILDNFKKYSESPGE